MTRKQRFILGLTGIICAMIVAAIGFGAIVSYAEASSPITRIEPVRNHVRTIRVVIQGDSQVDRNVDKWRTRALIAECMLGRVFEDASHTARDAELAQLCMKRRGVYRAFIARFSDKSGGVK